MRYGLLHRLTLHFTLHYINIIFSLQRRGEEPISLPGMSLLIFENSQHPVSSPNPPMNVFKAPAHLQSRRGTVFPYTGHHTYIIMSKDNTIYLFICSGSTLIMLTCAAFEISHRLQVYYNYHGWATLVSDVVWFLWDAWNFMKAHRDSPFVNK